MLCMQVSNMAKQAAAERSAAFVPNAPGSFVTISNKTGVLLLHAKGTASVAVAGTIPAAAKLLHC